MAVIKCKMCGGELVLSQDQTVAECEYCGSRQTVPKVDDERKVSLFARAERLRRNCEFDKAAGIYESIVSDFPEEAEAYWGLVLCRYGIEYVDDPATGKKIPTCHRSSFESVMEDQDLDLTLEYADGPARRVYREEAKQIEELRKGIIAVSANEKPYDIFICYKETDEEGDRTLDSVLAQDIYDALTAKGYRVFFSRISLEDKLGIEFEPYIFAALNSARVMLAVGTDHDYYNAVWVKNEWSRFLKLMAKDKQKHLIPCFKGLDAYDMPREFARLQAQDLGKVGAIQDLMRGIEKLLPRETAAPAEQRPEQPAPGPVTAGVDPLLDRISLFLEDRNFDDAAAYCERVLDADPRNAQAYLCKFLIQQRQPDLESLVKARIAGLKQPQGEKQTLAPEPADISGKISQYLVPNYLTERELRPLYAGRSDYTTFSAQWRKLKDREETFWSSQKDLNRAVQFASGSLSGQIADAKGRVLRELDRKIALAEQQDAEAEAAAKQYLEEMLQIADRAARKRSDSAEARRNAHYTALVNEVETADRRRLTALEKELQALGDYMEAPRHAARCAERVRELDDAAEQARLTRLGRDYDSLVERMDTATHQELSVMADRFRGMGDFRDAQDLARQCRARSEELREQVRQREREKAIRRYRENVRKNRRQKLLTAVVAFLLIGGIAVTLWYFLVYRRDQTFERGMQAMRSGDFAAAADAFGSLGGYRESDNWYLEARYLYGKALMKEGSQEKAVMVFNGIPKYEDSLKLRDQLWQKLAVRDTISAGENIIAGIRKDGSVRFAGAFSDSWDDIIAVDCGWHHVVALDDLGRVHATGLDSSNQCSVGSWTDIVAVSAGMSHTVGLKADGTVVATGDHYRDRCDVNGWYDIIAVSAGGYHTLGLMADGTVVATGDTARGRCDVGGWSDIVAISAGANHSVGLKADGTVVAAGFNGDGQCDVSDWTDIVAVSAGNTFTLGLKADGTVVAAGSIEKGQHLISTWTDVVAISAGYDVAVGLTADRTVLFLGNTADDKDDAAKWTDIRLPS